MTSANDIADRFFAAIEVGDVATVRTLYAPDAVGWHNHDGAEQTAQQSLTVPQWVIDNLVDRRYELVRREATSSGFVQQHVLSFTRADGTREAIPACVVVAVDADKISRIGEYLDSAHIARLTG